MTSTPLPSDGHSKHLDVRNQRFLVISSLFPPDIMGGAEVSASNLALWLHKQGAEVGVITTAKTPAEAHGAKDINGLKTWRLWMPRAHSQFNASSAKWWQKIIWHLQDHFDPRNRKMIGPIIQEFNPNYINVHLLQGIGYNVLADIAAAKARTTYFLHDLSLACFRMGMFKNGHTCKTKCGLCVLSSAYKIHGVKKIESLDFVSPSRANLETMAQYFPIKNWRSGAIINVNRYPVPTVAREESPVLRILYVGRLHVTKGVDILLEAANNLASKYNFTMTIIGSGPEEAKLRAQYGDKPWCKFTGFVSQQEISNYMANSDVLCVPSVWAEVLGGVIIHALGLGLPVFGSNKGGIPELIDHEQNGLLLSPGDLAAWQGALNRILADPDTLTPWRAYALVNAYKFDQDYLGNKLLNFICSTSEK